MPIAHYQTLADDVFCIETGLYRDGLAACYLVRERDRLAVIDTGTANTVPGLLGVIEDLGLTPGHVDWVIPTHVHLDHAGGAGALMAACPNARTASRLRSPGTCWRMPAAMAVSSKRPACASCSR